MANRIWELDEKAQAALDAGDETMCEFYYNQARNEEIMADANLMKIAESLGLEVRTRNTTGKVWISGTTSEVLRAWAMAGYDRRTEPKTGLSGQDVNSYVFTLNGEYAGQAASLDGFTFSSM